jgi:hypothetical protein
MEASLNDLDVDTLRNMYEKESANLKSALLSGTSWADLKDQRQKVTELSIVLHKKIHASTGNPAESTDRSEKRMQR